MHSKKHERFFKLNWKLKTDIFKLQKNSANTQPIFNTKFVIALKF